MDKNEWIAFLREYGEAGERRFKERLKKIADERKQRKEEEKASQNENGTGNP